MDVESYENGVPSWVDLGVSDPKKAATFYSQLLGWGAAGVGRLRDRASPRQGGGRARASTEPGPPVWMTYFTVDDTDKAVEQIKSLGGELVMGPMESSRGGSRLSATTRTPTSTSSP